MSKKLVDGFLAALSQDIDDVYVQISRLHEKPPSENDFVHLYGALLTVVETNPAPGNHRQHNAASALAGLAIILPWSYAGKAMHRLESQLHFVESEEVQAKLTEACVLILKMHIKDINPRYLDMAINTLHALSQVGASALCRAAAKVGLDFMRECGYR